MKSKNDRLNISIENIEQAINYYLVDLNRSYKLCNVSKEEYAKTSKDLKDISKLLLDLKKSTVFKSSKLDEIRVINLSIMHLYDAGDYNSIFTELIHTNSVLCDAEKEKDKKRLSSLEKVVNHLSNFYKFRLTKAVYEYEKGITYHDKKVDNIKFVLENYLSIKYNFKKLKYESLNINEKYQNCIDGCDKIIKTDTNSEVKEYYSSIRSCLINFARSELIITNLEKIIYLCDDSVFDNIKEKTKMFIDKYRKVYEVSKDKYNKLIEKNVNINYDFVLLDSNVEVDKNVLIK